VVNAALVAVVLCSSSPAAETVQQVMVFAATDGVLISGTFQGRPLTFLLDTGTSISSVDAGLAGRASGVLDRTFGATGLGSAPRPTGVLVRSLRIQLPYDGGEVAHDVLHVADYSRLSALKGQEVHGVLGADFLQRFTVEFDFARARVLLHPPKQFKPSADAITMPMRLSGSRRPLVEVGVHLPGGKRVKATALLDTGNAGDALAAERFQTRHRLGEVLTGSAEFLGEGAGGKMYGRKAHLPAMEIGPFRFDETIIVLPAPNSGSISSTREYDINIGVRLLRRFSATFNYRRSRIYLVPNEPSVR
jgi:hypothetical protein